MSLSVRFVLYESLVFLVALVKLLHLIVVFFFPLIWTLGNEISTLTIIVAYIFLSWLLFSIYLERSFLLMNLLNFLINRDISSSSSSSSLGLSIIIFFFLLLLLALRAISCLLEVKTSL
jgi:hypothetical protein